MGIERQGGEWDNTFLRSHFLFQAPSISFVMAKGVALYLYVE